MHAELRAAVLNNPNDDALRQVFADALTEAGSSQGPFITHQLALASMNALDPRRTPLIVETRRLQLAFTQEWLTPLLSELGDLHTRRLRVSSLRNAHFDRGFLSRIALTPEDFPLLELLTKQTPLEGAQLVFTEYVPDVTINTSRWRWMKISPDDWFTAHSVAKVLCWGTASLRSLDLAGCDLGVDGARLVVGMPTDLAERFPDHVDPEPIPAGQLQELVLDGTNLFQTGLEVLLQAGEQLAGLRKLSLRQCRIEDGILPLATTAIGASLEELSLAGNNQLDIAGLAGWERWAHLRSIGLPKSITPEVFSALLPGSAVLRKLNLSAAKPLLKHPDLVFAAGEHFTHLDLSGTGLGDPGFETLLAAPSTHSLDELQVGRCSLSDRSIKALVSSELAHLVALDISSNKLTDAALHALAGWTGVGNLLSLRTRNNRKLTPAGFEALIACDAFQPVAFEVGPVKDDALRARLRSRFTQALIE